MYLPREDQKKRQTDKEPCLDPIKHDHCYYNTEKEEHVHHLQLPDIGVDSYMTEAIIQDEQDLGMNIFMEEETCTVQDAIEEVELTELDDIILSFDEMKGKLVSAFQDDNSVVLVNSPEMIQICQIYPATETVCVKLNVNIYRDMNVKVFVHKIELRSEHSFWHGLPLTYNCIRKVKDLLKKLDSYQICCGNFDPDLIEGIPIGSAVTQASPDSSNSQGFREGDFGAAYSSSVRNINCQLLVNGQRCSPCSQLRRVLVARRYRQQEKDKKPATPDYVHYKKQHKNMTRQELIFKIKQQKEVISSLETEILRTKQQFQKELSSKGVNLDLCQSLELKDTMSTCTSEIEQAFPDENSYQRLFWSEQLKCMNVRSQKGMRWHPMIVRWCLYLRQKSTAAYDALRDSGFIRLPSTRTLFDYSHYTKSGNGFMPDVIEMLKGECDKRDMYNPNTTWKNFVGVLFDEIKIKSDLVYDKHTGELIGYCNLDKVGNQMLEFEKMSKNNDSNDVAKYMLVLMVRGVVTDLKFPLAGFSTMSITADFLYPIIWKAIRILETSCTQLRVLFLTCDGASANRRFFNLHGQDNDFIHYTDNPFATDNRKIFFVSDVPHLLKTTRNCFSNSYSHKNTRKLWNDGKDISWIHLLTLFEQHCELALYSPCPKLTRSHVDMTTFGCMKVNLAAQIMSSTVANALEMMYGDHVSETVNFIRKINRFFDCLNVRSLYEGRNKRNPDLNPYTSIDDERLQWFI